MYRYIKLSTMHKYVYSVFIAALFIIARSWKIVTPHPDNGYKKGGSFTQ